MPTWVPRKGIGVYAWNSRRQRTRGAMLPDFSGFTRGQDTDRYKLASSAKLEIYVYIRAFDAAF